MCECVFLVKQKTAYELRISDWSSDVCSSDLGEIAPAQTVIVLAARFQEAECYSALNLCFARPGVDIVVGRHDRWIGRRGQRRIITSPDFPAKLVDRKIGQRLRRSAIARNERQCGNRSCYSSHSLIRHR